MPTLLPIAARGLCLAILATTGAALAEPNPLARFPAPETFVGGRWNGVDLERRTGCTRPENEGSRGTYAQFDVATDSTGTFGIGQTGITGLNCNYNGRYQVTHGRMSVQGTYSCTDGKQGAFQSIAVDAKPTSLDIRMAIQLGGAETCAIDKILSMARF